MSCFGYDQSTLNKAKRQEARDIAEKIHLPCTSLIPGHRASNNPWASLSVIQPSKREKKTRYRVGFVESTLCI